MLGASCSGCCGGWTCYEPNCNRFACSTVTVAVQSQQRLDRLIWNLRTGPCPHQWSTSGLFPGDQFSGTFTMQQQTETRWAYTYPASGNVCGGSNITVECNPENAAISLRANMPGLNICDRRAVNTYQPSDFSCTLVQSGLSNILCDFFRKSTFGGLSNELATPESTPTTPGQMVFLFSAQARLPFCVGADEQDFLVSGTPVQFEPVYFTVTFAL